MGRKKQTSLSQSFLIACAKRWNTRFEMGEEEWIETHGSGTLRKNRRLGMSWREQYIHERVAFEYGYGFEALSSSRIATGVALTSGDCKPSTETGWHTDRHQTLDIFGDKAKPAYIYVEYADGSRKEGIGIILEISNRPSWLSKDRVLFAIVSEYDTVKRVYLPSQNPF